jgi:glycosyltransferase involved in cell wall biosynthesis
MVEEAFRFSVVVPTKDRPALLARALRSALEQRFDDFEIVVADDGSGDGAALARDMVGGNLQTIVTGKLGQVPARNMAIAAARGRSIAFLDDDDHWADPWHLEALAAALDSGAGLVCSDGRIVREGPGAKPDDWIPITADLDPARLRRDNTLIVSGVAYDRALHTALGPLDETLPHYWDWDWYLRLAVAHTPFAAARKSDVHISVRHDTVSAPSNEEARRSELARLCEKHGLVGVTLKNHEIIALEQQVQLRPVDLRLRERRSAH